MKPIKRYPPRGRGRLRFASNGVLVGGSFPAECILDCSASGQVVESVQYWRDKLDLIESLEPVKSQAISYLREFGAWQDLGCASMEDIADRVLWTACCAIKEEGEWLGLCH